VDQIIAALSTQRRNYRRLGFSTERIDLYLAELKRQSPARPSCRWLVELAAAGQAALTRLRASLPGLDRVRL
jgi:hypothetical protein